ncbi:MAG: hypothetical protein LBR89_02785 [Holosporales bacterium]|nr:hypothetical protein [Holosporales bacterium]
MTSQIFSQLLRTRAASCNSLMMESTASFDDAQHGKNDATQNNIAEVHNIAEVFLMFASRAAIMRRNI